MNRWKYYLIHFSVMGIWFAIGSFYSFLLINIVFFMLAYTWHFTLETPGARDVWLKSKKRYSFVAIIFKLNHYLQVYSVHLEKKLPNFFMRYKSSIVRSVSPMAFCIVLLFFGGSGNIFFVLLGSLIFEMCQALFKLSLGSF